MTSFIVSFSDFRGQHARDTKPVTRWVKANGSRVTKSRYIKVGETTYARLDFSDDTAAVEFKLSDYAETHQPPNIDLAWQWVMKAHCLDHCCGSEAVHEKYYWLTWSSTGHPWELSPGVKGRITYAYNRHLNEEVLEAEIRAEVELRRKRFNWTQMANLMEDFGIPLMQPPPDGLFDD